MYCIDAGEAAKDNEVSEKYNPSVHEAYRPPSSGFAISVFSALLYNCAIAVSRVEAGTYMY